MEFKCYRASGSLSNSFDRYIVQMGMSHIKNFMATSPLKKSNLQLFSYISYSSIYSPSLCFWEHKYRHTYLNVHMGTIMLVEHLNLTMMNHDKIVFYAVTFQYSHHSNLRSREPNWRRVSI